jgi:hypothetical protein
MLLALVSVAFARSPCADLKPAHKPSKVDLGAASSTVSTALAAAGVPASQALAALPKNLVVGGGGAGPGATGWALYQVCLLKEAGVFTPDQAAQVAQAVLVGNGPVAPSGQTPTSTAVDASILDARAQMKRNIQYVCGIPGAEQSCEVAKRQLQQFDEANHISMP